MEFTTQKIRSKPKIDITNIYGKLPPQSRDLEEVILGAVMLESFCLPVVVGLVFEEVFYVDAHQRIFKAIVQLYDANRKVDIATVVEKLKANEELENVGGAFYVTKLTNSVVSSANVEEHCHIILQKYLSREMIRIGGEAVGEAYDDSTDAFELFDKTDAELLQTQEKVLGGIVKGMGHYAATVYNEYETVKEYGVLGVQTGIIPIDKIFSGLVAPDLFIVAARPGHGKTALALSITHQVSVMGNTPCAWFSLEMNGTQLTRRLASIHSGLSHELIKQGRLSKQEEVKLFNSIDVISQSPVFIEDKPNINIRNIRTRANILVRRNKIKFIVVDYLQLMNGVDTKNKNRESVISEISRGLKQLALELSIPVIALSQLNREVESRPDKMPQLSDLRESGAIEQDADEVLFLMRPEYYDFREDVGINKKHYSVGGLCIGKAAKNRHGKCTNFAMHFNAPSMHFSTHLRDIDFPQPANVAFTPYADKDDNVPF
jgi:replicative DNA helicase